MIMRLPGVFMFVFILLVSSHLQSQDTSVAPAKSLVQKVVMKFYPVSLATGQLVGHTSEFRMAVEYKFARHHSFQAGASAVFPNPFYAIVSSGGGLFACYECSDPYWLFGGRGIVSYRYYFKERPRNPFGWFVGGELSVNGMGTKTRKDRYDPNPYSGSSYVWTVSSRTRGIIGNCNVTGGYQFTKEKRYGTLVLEIGASVGYCYNHFWRKYSWGDLEFYPGSGWNGFFKKVPIGGAINVSIGGFLSGGERIQRSRVQFF